MADEQITNPEPSTAEPEESSLSLGDLEFAYNDDGETIVVGLEEEEAVQDTTVPDESQTDWEKRYSDLRPEFDRRSQELSELRERLARLEGAAGATTEEKPEDEDVPYLQQFSDEDLYETFQDPQRTREFLGDFASRIALGIQQHAGEILGFDPSMAKSLMRKESIREEYEALAEEHGQAFIDARPLILKTLKAFPKRNLTMAQAFALVQTLGASDAGTAPQLDASATEGSAPSGTPEFTTPASAPAAPNRRPSPPPPPVETGSAGSDLRPSKTEAKTFREAFNQTLREHLG